MPKKHFIALADLVRDYNRDAEDIGQRAFDRRQIQALADFCASQNPLFDRDRWLSYIAGTCGPCGGRR